MHEEAKKKRGVTHEPVLPKGETPCVWMLAGVLTCWLCDRDLACETCPLDAALRHEADRHGRAAPAPPAPQPQEAATSRAALHGEDSRPAPAGSKLEDLLTTDLMPLETQRLYARDHMWALPEDDGLVRVGLDAFAARIVGRLRCVVLAPVGTRLRKGRPCAWLDMLGGTLTLLAPISGQVVQCNEELGRRTDLEIREPFTDEWLLKLQPFRIRTESQELMGATEFAPWVQEDFALWQEELRQALQSDVVSLGRTMADGGHSVRTLVELLGSRGVHRLASRSLAPPGISKPKDRKSR